MSESSSQPDIRQLIEEHYEMLFRFAWRLSGSQEDAEDLTQQTFLTAHRKLHQLEKPEAAKSWLCTILRRQFLRTVEQSPVSLEAIPEPDNTTSEDVLDTFDSESLQAALQDLPEEFRTPIILFYLGEFSYNQIAEQMEIPLGTVMSRLARGREHLKQRLIARGFIETPS
ncbi:MAG: RNA polymerase sigma factor [Planctomycetaceae bacterium]|nr:RNA polymerase sigma factor [Planctomycetaceae bacterium]